MTSERVSALLPTDLLAEFRSRAVEYDAANVFFTEDLSALAQRGYLAAVVPESFGGAGLSLSELIAAQRRLAAYAPATALGINMHLVWVQVARFLHDRGIDTLDWVLRDAVAGEVFAFGISEAGNDAVLLDAVTTAHADERGYTLNGTKIFTTLSPVWTRLGVHAKIADSVASADAAEQLLFGFVRRDGGELREGEITHPGVWNPLGMRATQSWNTRLEGVRVDTADIAAVMPALEGRHPLILGIFSSFSLLTAAVYAGIADRALELAQAGAARPLTLPGGSEGIGLDDPDTAFRLTQTELDHRTSLDALEILARDVDALATRDDWSLALAAARNRVTDEARRAVDTAMRLSGAAGFQADSELARLYRDVLAGLFHPSSSRSLGRSVRASFEL